MTPIAGNNGKGIHHPSVYADHTDAEQYVNIIIFMDGQAKDGQDPEKTEDAIRTLFSLIKTRVYFYKVFREKRIAPPHHIISYHII